MKKILISLLFILNFAFIFGQGDLYKTNVYVSNKLTAKKIVVNDTIVCDSVKVCNLDTCIWVSPYTLSRLGRTYLEGNGIYIQNDTIKQSGYFIVAKDSSWGLDANGGGTIELSNNGDSIRVFRVEVNRNNDETLGESDIYAHPDSIQLQHRKNDTIVGVILDERGLRISNEGEFSWYPNPSKWDVNNFITKGYADTAYTSGSSDTISLSNRIDAKLNISDSITKYKTPTQFKTDTVTTSNTGTVTKYMFNRWEAKQNALGFTPLSILDTVDRSKVGTRKVIDSLLAIYGGTYIDIAKYGAVGDSITDNHQAFASAIAACPYNGSVLIGPGNFKVNKRILVNKKITFLGLGGQIIFSMDSALFRIRSNNVSFSNLKIRGDGNVSKTNQIAIYDSSYLNITVEKCDFTNIGGSAIYSTNIFTNPGLSVIGGVIEGGGNGIFFDTRGEYSSVTGTLIRTAQKGVRVKAGNIILKGLNVVGCVDGISIEPGTNGAHGIIDGCQSNHNSGYALKIDSATLGETVSDCHFYDGGVYVKNSKSVKFNNCYFEPDYLRFENSTECMVSKSTFDAGLGMSTIETSYNNQPSIVYFEGNVGGQTTIPRQEFGYQNDYKAAQSGTTLDLGLAKRQYRSLSADVTITSLTNAKKGKYYVEILGNGYTWNLIDNTRYSGKYDKNKLNVFEIDVTNESPNLNWTASISQPTIIRDTTQRNVTFIYPNRSVITVPIASNTITKSSGSSSNWDGYASCTETLLGNGTIQAKWTVSQLNSMFGFSTNPLTTNITNMRYGIYFSGTNVYKCENGSVSGILTTAAANNLFRVRVIGTSVIYQKSTDNGANWTTISTAAQAAVFPLKVMIMIRGLNDVITDVKIHGWCGNYFDMLAYPATQVDSVKNTNLTSLKYNQIYRTSTNIGSYIDSSGNQYLKGKLAIGILNPDSLLEVNGGIKARAARIGVGSNYLTINNRGGIILPSGSTGTGTAPLKLTTQASGLTTVEQGAFELIGNSLQFTNLAVRRSVVQNSLMITSDVSVTNTVTETEIASIPHGANYLEIGKKENTSLQGTINSISGVGANTLTIRVKYAGTTYATFVIPEAARTTQNIEIHVMTTCRAIGNGTTTVQIHARSQIDNESNDATVNTLATGLNSTVMQATSITAEWSDASASNSLVILQGECICVDKPK